MNHIVLHPGDDSSAIHRLIAECPFLVPDLFDSLRGSFNYLKSNEKVRFYTFESIPPSAENVSLVNSENLLSLKNLPISGTRTLIANARYIASFNPDHLDRIFKNADADIVCVEIDPNLCGFREKIVFEATGKIAGLRRIYSDIAVPSSVPTEWPEMVFISNKAITCQNGLNDIPVAFEDFINKCNRKSLTVRCVRVAGTSHDLYDTSELLYFLETNLKVSGSRNHRNIPDSARLFGKVLLGENVTIGDNCIIVGPAIIGDNVKIQSDSVVRNSIVGHNIDLKEKLTEHCFISNSDSNHIVKAQYEPKISVKQVYYRTWPVLSYAGLWKRVADIIFASFILLLSLPVFIIVIVAIKYASPGPIFFSHKRQGLHGKPFGCIKFRTMIVGADDIQDQLRKINEVDGPQFKMDDDPRVNTIGKFLRDTCIDEIPQFINVLMGQMSVIGPRPSPEKENAFCAYWRDARLSVRPGITGLWQIKRTRQEGQDFQEWVIHDTAYVKKISLISDIKICLLTVRHIVKSLIEQF